MKFSRTVADVATEVKDTAGRIGQTAQWTTAALVGITLVSVVALLVATTALVSVKR